MSEVHGPQTIGDFFQAEGFAHEGESHVQGLIAPGDVSIDRDSPQFKMPGILGGGKRVGKLRALGW